MLYEVITNGIAAVKRTTGEQSALDHGFVAERENFLAFLASGHELRSLLGSGLVRNRVFHLRHGRLVADHDSEVRTVQLAKTAVDTVFFPNHRGLAVLADLEHLARTELHADAAPLAPVRIDGDRRITSYNVCYTKLLRNDIDNISMNFISLTFSF